MVFLYGAYIGVLQSFFRPIMGIIFQMAGISENQDSVIGSYPDSFTRILHQIIDGAYGETLLCCQFLEQLSFVIEQKQSFGSYP